MNAHVTVATSSMLASRAVIVSLKISQWSGRRLDRDVTDEVNQSHNADADAGRFNKLLIPKDALKDITKVVSETRSEFEKRTLPWIDRGGRIMDASAYMQNGRWVSGQIAKFDAAVSKFLGEYPGYVAAAGARLGTMFDPSDYPTADELKAKYNMELVVMPVPTGDDFRVAMSEHQASRIRAQIEARVEEAQRNAVADVYRRITEALERMVNRLSNYQPAEQTGDRAIGIFRDSLVDNVRDLIEVLPSLNITGDPVLAAMASRLRPLVEFKAETLREDAGKRRDVAHEAQKILDTLSDFIA